MKIRSIHIFCILLLIMIALFGLLMSDSFQEEYSIEDDACPFQRDGGYNITFGPIRENDDGRPVKNVRMTAIIPDGKKYQALSNETGKCIFYHMPWEKFPNETHYYVQKRVYKDITWDEGEKEPELILVYPTGTTGLMVILSFLIVFEPIFGIALIADYFIRHFKRRGNKKNQQK